MSFASFWSDFLATIFGGIALTLIFFFLKEKYFSPPKLTGRWFLEQKTQVTAYVPYEGMVLRYVVMLWLEGNRVEGTAEKIYDNVYDVRSGAPGTALDGSRYGDW